MKFDEYSTHGVASITPGTTIIDTQGYEALTFVFSYGATSVVTITGGDDPALADGVIIPAENLRGPTTFTDSGVGLLGVVAGYRYYKFSETNPVANTSTYALEGFLYRAPVGS